MKILCVLRFTQQQQQKKKKLSWVKKSSDVSSSMIEIAYHPTLVPMYMDNFEDDFQEIEDNEVCEEYSD